MLQDDYLHFISISWDLYFSTSLTIKYQEEIYY